MTVLGGFSTMIFFFPANTSLINKKNYNTYFALPFPRQAIKHPNFRNFQYYISLESNSAVLLIIAWLNKKK